MPARGDFAPSRSLIKLSFIALGIGVVATLVAAALYHLIGFFTNLFFFQRWSFAFTPPIGVEPRWVILVVPILGGLIIGLMARFGTERIRGHGIPEALESILFGGSKMSPRVAILKPLSSAISIGSGGPFGAEGPIIMTGGAFGSLISQLFYLSAIERRALLVAGASAGMSATFDTPIAATLLAVELLLFEWRPRTFVPVAVASIVASVLRPLVLGSGPLFPVTVQFHPTWVDLSMAVVAGLVAAGVSACLTIAVYKAEDGFHKLPIHWMWWPAIGGVAIAIGGYFEPHAMGVGYVAIRKLLDGQMLAVTAGVLILIKGIIWSISLGSGTSGGVLAPLLLMGAGLGAVEAAVFPGISSPVLWPLVSMGAVLGGVMRVPFTSILFCLELTDNVSMLGPLFIACLVAYAVSVFTMRRSILTEKVARRGYDIFREYSVDHLEQTPIGDVMTREVVTIPDDLTMQEVKDRFFGEEQLHRGYPVVDENKRLLGMITRSLLKDYRDNGGDMHKPLKEFLEQNEARFTHADRSCRELATRMVAAREDRMPVVAPDGSYTLIGLVTRHDLLKPASYYAKEEMTRERIFRARLRLPVNNSLRKRNKNKDHNTPEG